MTSGTDQQLEIVIAPSWFDQVVARFGPTAYRGVLSITDQMVVSGTRFMTSVIVGRACGPQELGDYTLGFTLYCVAICVQMALISVPFTIFGSYLQGDERRLYSGSALAHSIAFGLTVMTLLGLASGVMALGYGPAGLAPLAAVLAFTFPLAFLVEFARRIALARLEMTAVLATDVVMSSIQIGGLLLLASLGRVSAVGAFAAMGLGAAIAGLTWLALARRLFVIRRSHVVADAKRNWRCGRWSLMSQLIIPVRNSVLLSMLALLLGATSTGIFVACDTLVRLSSPLMLAVANILFPSAAQAFARGHTFEVRRLVLQAAALLGAGTALLCGLFVLFGDPALAKLYGDAYRGQGVVVSLLALVVVGDALDIAASNGLLAINRPNVVFVANLLGTATTLAMAAILVARWGIVGAAWGSLLGRCVTSAVQWVTFLQLTDSSAALEAQQ